MKQPCECCGVFQSIGVYSSTLGPISLAYCKRCIQFGAEPLWLVEFTLDSIGGWKNAAEWLRYITIPIGPGQYIFADQYI